MAAAVLGLLIAILFTVLATACSGRGSGGGDSSAPPDGARLFARNCAACHGAGGAGDGPRADRRLGSADLTDPALHERLSDADINRVIRRGKRRMNPVGGLNQGERSALIEFVRSLRQ